MRLALQSLLLSIVMSGCVLFDQPGNYYLISGKVINATTEKPVTDHELELEHQYLSIRNFLIASRKTYLETITSDIGEFEFKAKKGHNYFINTTSFDELRTHKNDAREPYFNNLDRDHRNLVLLYTPKR